ncbi:DUF2934 domain-containing protein [candidate division KSB1 bacterium]|nr:DUF2934 domain-containing protein [candidate division KSB1 bacterium]
MKTTKKSTAKTKAPANTKKTARSGKSIDPDKLNEEIRKRAHEISLERGNEDGDSMSDWLEAEREIKKKFRQK